jgi:hypothetical protein
MNSRVLLTINLFLLLVFSGAASAQSTSQDFPTPVMANEIAGSINARDIGDSRLTTYYYTFNGDQGDLFINIVTKNFTGDLDVFTASTLRPVTKIVIYASDTENETGRAVYFRKPEKLLLRIQGRTPNDDPASFRIKFAGSFLAAKESDVPSGPELPKVASGRESGIRVNSVGTLLPPEPKPIVVTEPAETAETTTKDKSDLSVPEATASVDPPKAEPERPAKSVELVVTDPVKTKEKPAATPSRRRRASRRPPAVKTELPAAETEAAAAELDVKDPPKRTAKKAKEPVPDPLATIRLVIAFKDGNSLEKSMSEVFRFSVDKGVLTVILKDGSVSRYPIIEVAKVTIE